MASWTSPRQRSYRDVSPTSPLSPLSPSVLPQWLRASRPRSGLLSSGRLRIAAVALGCMLLGWTVSWTLGPVDRDVIAASGKSYGETFDDASRYGADTGMVGLDSGWTEPPGPPLQKEPTIGTALSDLHHAVHNKIQSWNPYRVSPPTASTNRTSSAVCGNRPPHDSSLDGEYIVHGDDDATRLGSHVRIGKCTILFNANGPSNTYWERAIRTHERHDKLNGYRLHVLRQNLMDDVWSKPAYILSLLLREMGKPEGERLDWLLWFDADTVVLNPHIPIETLLPPPGREFEDVHLLYTNDWNGLNNGVFPVRVNRWSVQLLSAITSWRHFRPDVPLPLRDQSAMEMLMKEPQFAKHVVNAPQRWFNAYQGEHNETLAPFQVRRGDLLVHFAGVPNRDVRMSYWLDRAEQHLDDWEVPVKSTSYPQEARDFWQEQRSMREGKARVISELRNKADTLVSSTDRNMQEYGEQLALDQAATIREGREQVQKVLEDGSWQHETVKLEAKLRQLEDAIVPLTSTITSTHKLLLGAAHEAIFAGEKDLHENIGVTNPETAKLAETVANLKQLVMSPETFWSRQDLLTATNAVTDARANLLATASAAVAAAHAQEEADKARAKAIEDARKQVLEEANIAPVPVPVPVPVLQAEAEVVVSTVMLTTQPPVQTAVAVGTIVPVETVVGPVITMTPEHVVSIVYATVVEQAAPVTTMVVAA